MTYNAPLFSECNSNLFLKAPKAEISSFHWEKEGYSRPESYISLYAAEGKGLHIKLWSFEADVRCVCQNRNDPVYTDSCLEVFLMPVKDDLRYINFEINPCGVYLSEIGAERHCRKLISSVTDIEPVITPFRLSEDSKSAWGCEIFIPDELISALYGTEYSTCEATVKGNFYKCADLSSSPHYGALFPVTTAELGFHNPDCFGDIIIRRACNNLD